MERGYDIAIVGSGAGGGTLAYALSGSGARIALIERGDFLPQEPENWSPEAVFAAHRYRANETWQDREGKPFHPGVHYFVGGNTKVYGAALPRLRREDFGALEHEGGISPAWIVVKSELSVGLPALTPVPFSPPFTRAAKVDKSSSPRIFLRLWHMRHDRSMMGRMCRS